jgi:hypothetical protein
MDGNPIGISKDFKAIRFTFERVKFNGMLILYEFGAVAMLAVERLYVWYWFDVLYV